MIRTYIESQGIYKFVQKLFGNTNRSAYRYTENILSKYQDLIEYKYLHNSSRRLNQIQTKKSISLVKGLKLGASINEVRKQFSVSPYVNSYKSKGLKRTILLYKIKYGGQKVKIEAHFYKNQLFFSKYIFSKVSETEQGGLVNLFGKKYGLQDLGFENKNIIDASHHCVKINTGTELSINYIQLENPFFEKMQSKMAIVPNEIDFNYGVNLGVQ